MSEKDHELQHTPAPSPEADAIRNLTELVGRREELRQLLTRLEAVRDDWPAAACERISRDYLDRSEELDRRIAPLEVEIPGWMASLESEAREVQKEIDALRLDQAEQDCRHSIGEFDAAELERRTEPLAARLAELDARRSTLHDQRASLLGVLDASGRTRFIACPADLAASYDPSGDPGPAGPTPAADAAPDLPAAESAREAESPQTAQLEPDPSDLASAALEADTLRIDADPGYEGTQVRRPAALIPFEPIDGRTRLVVEPLTTIGRDPGNLHAIVDPTVSRRHATLTLTPQGYLLTDLQSGNGTRVNGEPIAETWLKDGDRVDFGMVAFTFEWTT